MSLAVLFKLQEHEYELKKIEKKMENLGDSGESKKLKTEYHKLKMILSKQDERLKSNHIQRDMKQNEISNLNTSMNESNAESVAEKQINELNEKKNSAYTQIEKLKEEENQIETEVISYKKKLNFIGKKYLLLKETEKKQISSLQVEAKELTQTVTSMQSQVDQSEYGIYKKAKARYNDPVAMIDGSKCTGCMVEMPTVEFETVRAGKTLVRCESCGRILYYRKA